MIEGNRRSSRSIAPILERKGLHVSRVTTRKEALSHIKSQRPELVIFDSALWRGDCGRLCGRLRDTGVPVLVLVEEGSTAADWTAGVAVLVRPFTSRKLVNCIQQMLPQADGDVLRLGDLSFYVQHRRVRKGTSDRRLTPMQARLLEVFMRHPGETLSRHYLIEQVWDWNTDDLNDTRTLDVHVRWLREIIEDDSTVPAYITTVRGVGYRFGVAEKAASSGS